jgi:molecular chaperone GrpE
MAEPNYKLYRVSQKAVLYNPEDKTYLLVKGSPSEDLFYKKMGPWEFVGGRVEKGEKLEEASRREFEEEVGEIEYEVKDLVGRLELEFKVNEEKVGLLIGYLTIYKSGEIQISDEHSEYKWETAENIEKSKEYKPWLKEWIKQAEKILKAEEYFNSWVRCQADFENYRKMQSQMQKDSLRYAISDIATQLFPVLDNFNASLDHVPEDEKKNPWVAGLTHIQRQLEQVLKDNGIETIEVKVGDDFDPQFHEAIGNHSEEKEIEHKISQIIQKGYKVGDRILRPAKVIVK